MGKGVSASIQMTFINVIGNLEIALNRFKTKCKRANIFDDLRKHAYYQKPSVKKREKRKRAIIRRIVEDREVGTGRGKAARRARRSRPFVGRKHEDVQTSQAYEGVSP